MTHKQLPAFPLISQAAQPLAGCCQVPGDKSLSHRALMFGAVAIGPTLIRGLLQAEDVLNTAKAMQALGADVEKTDVGDWLVHGVGVAGLKSPEHALDFGNSGTGARLCMGLMATTPLVAQCTGDASLTQRPMGRVTTPLKLFGTGFATAPGDRLPLTLSGARHAVPISYRLPVASAQVKSAILLAALNTPGQTTVIEPVPSRDHTERMLRAFGAHLEISDLVDGRHITVTGQHELKAQKIYIPGDPSSAAFLIVAALITRGSDIIIENIMLNPTRTGLITTLQEMGGDITIENQRLGGGEDVGDLHVRYSTLHGVTVPASRAPAMIDEYPILSVAASFADGITRMAGLEELRVKESDRLAAVEAGLVANGVKAASGPDWLEVVGTGRVQGGGTVITHMDHRIAMSFLIMGLASELGVVVDDGSYITTSFPSFAGLMNRLGAKISAWEGP